MADVEAQIAIECDRIKELLISKNRGYGNSIFDPIRIFSKAAIKEQIGVRIDDKLSRLARGDTSEIEEKTVEDLIGYLILDLIRERIVGDETDE